MATARLVPSTIYNAASSYVTISNASNAYTNTDSTNYATAQNTNASTSNRYIYLRGFNFSSIPSNATINSFTVKLKAYQSGGSTNTSYRPYLCNDTTTITGNCGAITTSTQTLSFTGVTATWDTIKGYGSNFGIRINCRRNSRNTTAYFYIYGAEIEVNYTAEVVHPTSVTLNKNSTTLEIGETEQLTETVLPSNATDKSVSWSSSNASVATVSNGLITAVSQGSAVITVTTTDGAKTDTCAVTVTQPSYTDYQIATTLEAGKSYLIVSGNSGSVHLLSNESNGSGSLKGVSATVTNGIISITGSVESKCLFDCVLQDNSNQNSTVLMAGSNYLYSDSSNHLRIASYTSSMDGKHWHYKADNKNLLWFFKDGTDNDGYTDTSSTYKYYLECDNSGNWADLHVSTTSLENTNTPAVYLFTERQQPSQTAYIKVNGSWVEATAVYKKISGSWVLQTDLTNVFDSGTNYKMG